MTEQALHFAEIVQPILAEERRLELSRRDIALLATIRVEIERNPDGLLSIPYSAIQGLSSRIDVLDVRDPQKAERRMSESMTRLLNAGCLTKAEILRLRLSGDAEYQLTSLDESVADWHVAQSRFSGELRGLWTRRSGFPVVDGLGGDAYESAHLRSRQTEPRPLRTHTLRFEPQFRFVFLVGGTTSPRFE